MLKKFKQIGRVINWQQSSFYNKFIVIFPMVLIFWCNWWRTAFTPDGIVAGIELHLARAVDYDVRLIWQRFYPLNKPANSKK
jgi:hypothetical protein